MGEAAVAIPGPGKLKRVGRFELARYSFAKEFGSAECTKNRVEAESTVDRSGPAAIDVPLHSAQRPTARQKKRKAG